MTTAIHHHERNTIMKNAPTIEETVSADSDNVDTVPASEEPRKRRGRPPGARNRPRSDDPAPIGRPTKTAALARSLEAQYTSVGALIVLFAPATGMALMTNAEQCAQALANWAATNPKIAKALERTMTGAGAVSVLVAHAPIALAVVADLQARSSTSNDDTAPSPFGDLAALFGQTPPPAA